MPKITFLPMNLTVEAREGGSILEAAIDHDIPIQHACGGFCACTTCHVRVVTGLQNLSETEEEELDRLECVDDYKDGSRLGCQAKIHGDLTVEVVNVDDDY